MSQYFEYLSNSLVVLGASSTINGSLYTHNYLTTPKVQDVTDGSEEGGNTVFAWADNASNCVVMGKTDNTTMHVLPFN